MIHDVTTLDGLRQAIGDWADLLCPNAHGDCLDYLLTRAVSHPQSPRYAIDDLQGRLRLILPTFTLLDFPALWIDEAWRTCQHETQECPHVRIEAAFAAVTS